MRHFRILVALALLCAMVLGGCRSNPDDLSGESTTTPVTSSATAPQNQGSLETEGATSPVPANGTLLTHRLDSGEKDAEFARHVGSGDFCETENGYYLLQNQILYYADKSDLRNWVPVCSQPDCKHTAAGGMCDALVPMEFIAKDGRLYYNTTASITAVFADSGLHGCFVASMALDGTDKRLEYYIPEIEEKINLEQIGERAVLIEDYFIYNLSTMNERGLFDFYLYLADDRGVTLLNSGVQELNRIGTLSFTQMCIYGDSGFCTSMIGESPQERINSACRIVDGELVVTDLEGLLQEGANLTGDSYWLYRTNDGYYNVDMTTREEVKLADSQLENSRAAILLRNCILESTLLWTNSLELRENVDTNAMMFFNGETWQEVTLPEELKNASNTTFLIPRAVTSDRILLVSIDRGSSMWKSTPQLYQILLTTDTPVLEHLADIG